MFKVLHPVVESVVALYPVFVGEIGVCVIGVGYIIDFAFSAAAAFRIHEKLPVIEAAMEQAKDEMLVRMHEKVASVGFAKEATLESVKERLADVEVLREMEQKRAAVTAEISAELQKRKEAMAAKAGHNMRRFVKSYPNLNRGYRLHNLKNIRDKKEKQHNE